MSLLWDLYQQHQIGDLNNRIADVGAAISTAEHRSRSVPDLEERITRLTLICRAMFELMQETAPGITEEQLGAKVVEIDLRDGHQDGRMTPKAKRCPKCEAMVSPKFGRCLFCGQADAESVRFS